MVDDEKDLLAGLQRSITMELDCNVLIADSSFKALETIRAEPVDVVLTDICMPGMDGIALLKAIKSHDPHITVIMMTAYGTIEVAVEAIKAGAYDFIQKPFQDDALMHMLRKGFELNRLVRENARLMAKVCEKAPFESIVGRSEKIRDVLQAIQALARTDVTVLILGETGTGKDLAARAIHAASSRRNQPLVTVNCPALPETILESELFGYRKGAFTNAAEDRKGLFDQAHGGTIFLDEIGDLPVSVQTKLLRVLQDQMIKPLGETASRHVDARIIAATNQNLKLKMEENTFRPDLYYRLNVASLYMPPLREFKEDIPLLVDHFLSKAACSMALPPKKIPAEVIDGLMARDWPGNVRELENLIMKWTALTGSSEIMVDDIELSRRRKNPAGGSIEISKPYKLLKDQAVETFTKDYLHRLLSHTRGNVTLSARISGIKRQSLQKILKRNGISAESYRRG